MFNEKTQMVILSEGARGRQFQKNLETIGFHSIVKETARAGIDFVEKTYPDLVIVRSPLRDATILDICRQMRQIRYYVPLIVYVEQADEYDRILALEMGADDYIAQPVHLRELAARIRVQLRRATWYAIPHNSVFNVGALVIDCTRGQAFCGRRSLDLTPIEFRLLKFLAQHHDQVLSREQILDQVWGYEPQSYGEQMVNVHICRLRRKVETDPLNPRLIVTVRGLGYRLIPNHR